MDRTEFRLWSRLRESQELVVNIQAVDMCLSLGVWSAFRVPTLKLIGRTNQVPPVEWPVISYLFVTAPFSEIVGVILN